MYKQSVDDDGGRSDKHTSSPSKKETCGSATLDTSPHWRSKLQFVIRFWKLCQRLFFSGKKRRLKDPNPNYWFRFQWSTHNYLTTTLASFRNLRSVEILISVSVLGILPLIPWFFLTRQKVGPIVVSDAARAAELEVSLLERLFERPLYCNYAQILHGQDVASYLVKSGLPFTNLVKVCIFLVLTKRSGDKIILELQKSSCYFDATFCHLL